MNENYLDMLFLLHVIPTPFSEDLFSRHISNVC